jgi:hypothetical protein
MRGSFMFTLACATLFGCQASPSASPGLVQEAKVGLFFGGQLQERREAPLELDPVRQNLGFRLRFLEPLAERSSIRWEVDVPGSRSTGGQRVVRLGRAELPQGQQAFDQKVSLEPGDPEGIYNFRCFLGGRLLVDRALLLYDPGQRRRLLKQYQDADD